MYESDTGKKIKARREELGLTLEQLGQAVGVGKSTVRKWETGMIANMRRDKIAILAKALKTTPAYLMGWDDEIPLASNIEPLPETKKIPIVGEIACGAPILAQENITDYADMPKTIHADFALICKGDSMVGAGIQDGDIVYIKKQDIIQNGQIAVVIVNSDCEATLKRFYRDGNKVTLTPENPAYPPMVYVNEEINSLRIVGRAVGYLHRF